MRILKSVLKEMPSSLSVNPRVCNLNWNFTVFSEFKRRPLVAATGFLSPFEITLNCNPATVESSNKSHLIPRCGAGMSWIASSDPIVAAADVSTVARTKYLVWLLVLFLLSLPLVNPWVRGDGVGYYAYARSMVIDRNLHFDADWLAANSSFIDGRVDATGHLRSDQYSPTGYVRNHFSVGPAILWAPFLIAIHVVVLVADRLGAAIPADGFSRPYLETMALATALYGFCGLVLAFDMARQYFNQTYAFLATLGIWLASSLPVYMYFNPSWSHAHSAFAVALFLWYWQRTRGGRSLGQWLVLALLAGLMMNVYYPNAILLLVPGLEAMWQYRGAFRSPDQKPQSVSKLFAEHLLFLLVAVLALLPTFVTRWILYGNPLESDYPSLRQWSWFSPKLLTVLFSADHGLLSWTPVLIPAILGLIVFWRRDPLLGGGVLLSFVAYFYFIASYPDWDGISSFGNRFFVSLSPLFVIGLAASLDFVCRCWRRHGRGLAAAAGVLGLLALWNGGLMLQWGTQMIPARGPIEWRDTINNQYAVVPVRVTRALDTYLFQRKINDAAYRGARQRSDKAKVAD